LVRQVSADGTAGAFRSIVVRRSTLSSRAAMLGAGGLLLGAVFALSFAISNPNEAVAVLYTLPIALIAVEVGAVGGIAAALVALALFGVWSASDASHHVGVLGFITRGTVFLLLGGLLGHFATKLRSAYDVVRRSDGRESQKAHDEVADEAETSAHERLPLPGWGPCPMARGGLISPRLSGL